MNEVSIPEVPAVPEPLPNITVDITKYNTYKPKIKETYLSNDKPSAAAMERLLKGIVPRAYIRQFMRSSKE